MEEGEEKKRDRKAIEKHKITKITTTVRYSSHSARFILVLLSST